MQIWRAQELAAHGVLTVGRVTAAEPWNHGRLRYTYHVEGRTYQDSGAGGDGNPDARHAAVGDPLRVYYLPTDPNVSTIQRPQRELMDQWIMLALGVSTLGGFAVVSELLMSAARRTYRHDWRHRTERDEADDLRRRRAEHAADLERRRAHRRPSRPWWQRLIDP